MLKFEPTSEQEIELSRLKQRWLRIFAEAGGPLQGTIDFETRSACDLRKHGAWLYSKHHTTRAMCLSYKLPGYERPGRWHMAHPDLLVSESPAPLDLFAFVLAGGLLEAHNAFFERCVWRNVMVARHGWPAMCSTQWRCSAAKASAASLPRDLEGAAKAMALDVEKDMEGRRLMLKLSKPRQPRKAEIVAWMEEEGLTGDYRRYKSRFTEANGPLWHETEEELERLWDYCDQDVLTEEALSEATPDLPEGELRLWQLDQCINEQGARFDLKLAKAALDLAAQYRVKLNRELEEMTGISAATKRQQVKDWLASNEGVVLPDTAADTLDWYLDREEMSGRARRVIEIVKYVNKTSTRKYQAMLDRTDPEDERARDLLMYHGASTGRWSGKGIQVQNFPRGNVKNRWGMTADGAEYAYFDIDLACQDILDGDLEWIESMHGDVMEVLSAALRGAIVPKDGHDLIVADYSAIEARCVLWLAGAEGALEVFRSGGDIYCDMAEGIYGYPVHKKTHPQERQFGKQAILGLGYGMGFMTFLLTCRKYGITFSVAQVKGILGDKYEKYYEWVQDYLFPKPTGDPRKDTDKRRQASKNRRRLTDEREDPKAVIHELALMKYTVDVYRTRYAEVKEMWAEQETAAMSAVRSWERKVTEAQETARSEWEDAWGPLDESIGFGQMDWETVSFRDAIEGPRYEAGMCAWFVRGGFLCCELPSGRLLRYRDPHIKPTKTAWGETKDGLRYMTVVTGGKWARAGTYGGKLVENITQAVARDIMADAALRTVDDGTPYSIIMSVHDELVAEVPQTEGSERDFEEVMSKTLPWADGCPVTAEAERYGRYRK